jgi:hypothetical protein
MTVSITIIIPKSIEKYADDLQMFVSGMVKKLDKNSWKETPTLKSIPQIIDLLGEEVTEFEQQFYDDKYDENVLVELMDAANYAFLAYVALRLQGLGNGLKIDVQP